MRIRRLRDKILIAIISLVLLLGIALAVIINSVVSKNLSAEMEKTGIRVAKDIARQSTRYIILNDALFLQTMINGYKRAESDIEYIFIINKKHDILAHTFKEGIPYALKKALAVDSDSTAYSVKRLLIQGEMILDIQVPIFKGDVGVVHLGISSASIKRVIYLIEKLNVVIIFFLLLICCVIGAVWSALVTRPVLELAKAAQAVGRGEFFLKIKKPGGDELGELADSFNKMSDLLQATTVSRKYLDDIFNSMMDSLIIVDKNGRITDINTAALGLLGYAKKEILGESLNRVFFDEKVELILKKISANRLVQGEERIYVTKRNQKIAMAFSASGLFDAGGAVKNIVCVAQDISRYKQIEQRLNRINACLLDFKVDPDKNIKSLVFVCAEVLNANCALYHNINGGGFCSHEQWEMPVDFDILKNGKGRICYDVMQQGLDKAVIVTDLPQTPYQQTDPNVIRYNLKAYMGQAVKLAGEVMGALCVVYQNNQVITEDDKRVLGIMCAAIATEERRKLAEKDLKDSVENLKLAQSQLLQKDKMANMGQLAGSVAHEINNPLTGVLNNAQLIKMMFEANQHIPPAELKELLNAIEESALRCKKITESLLDFSHASIGEFRNVSLNGVIEKVSVLISNEMKLQNIVIQKELQPGMPDIQGDPQLLQQIIVNLISNAKWAIEKRLGKSGGLIKIKSEADPGKKHVYLYFADNGIGIPEEKIGKIFDSFFTTKQVGVGTGLGLSLVSGIIKKHKGSIEVKSRVNEGTTFTITFPVSVV